MTSRRIWDGRWREWGQVRSPESHRNRNGIAAESGIARKACRGSQAMARLQCLTIRSHGDSARFRCDPGRFRRSLLFPVYLDRVSQLEAESALCGEHDFFVAGEG